MDKSFKTIMAQKIAELNVAIEYCKFDFKNMEAEYENAFPPAGNLYHYIALDIAMQNFKDVHQHFESLCNDRPLILETETAAMDELITKLNSANERCKANFAIMEDAYVEVIRYGLVDHNWVLGIAMGNLRRAHWYLQWECDNARQYLMTAGVGPGQQVGPDANAVVANVSEEHDTAAINTFTGQQRIKRAAVREEMVEGNKKSRLN